MARFLIHSTKNIPMNRLRHGVRLQHGLTAIEHPVEDFLHFIPVVFSVRIDIRILPNPDK